MTFQPNNITREHVLNAISKIELEQIELIPSTRWLVIVDGKTYPPKEVMRYAHEQMNGEKIWKLSGGKDTNTILTKLGFEITTANSSNDPLKNLVDNYKRYIHQFGMTDELYKWKLLGQFKGRPNTDVTDFAKEIEGINFSNLIYPNGISVIKQLAKDSTERCRECFKVLFDETKKLSERVKYFNEETLKIYRDILKENEFSHHQDERTISTYLTYHNPEKYTFYKNSFYVKVCKLLNINHKKKGDKYLHYMDIIDSLVENYINEDEELSNIIQNQNDGSLFADTTHKILAQDILYQTLEKQEFNERSYWRIGTSSSDGKEKVWDYMKSNSKICIAWGEIGDLNEVEIKSKNDIITLLRKEATYDEKNQSLISRKAGEIYEFYNDIKIGDIVLAQDGEQILGIGIITDEYSFDGSMSFAHQMDVEWICISPDLKNKEGNQTTVWKLKTPELKKQIDSLLQKWQKMNDDKPLNQILYGPPGTGKTYNTINHALKIIDEVEEKQLNWQDREKVKSLFDKRMSEGRIVFTTFHQSMSYEDFIEGIKPVISENSSDSGESINFKIIPGIFRKLCVEAAFSIAQKSEFNNTELVLGFSNQYDNFIAEIEEKFLNEENVAFFTVNGGIVSVDSISQKSNLILRHLRGSKKYTVSKGRLSKLNSAYPDLDRLTNINEQFRDVIGGNNSTVYWAVLNAIRERYKKHVKVPIDIISNKKYTYEDIAEVVSSMTPLDYKNCEGKPYVLIIDEINRGNVSQIFGELITLIEDDKRLGMPEALEITLPYSKEKFGVPPNLYIIGTMNTADRSVEALDAALRRRFSFTEMQPKPELIAQEGTLKAKQGVVEEIDVPKLLTVINKRIEKLLDKDHQIGHSYFMSVKSLDDLKRVFQNKILPLLQEYFFGDYGKIGLVLGDAFVEAEKIDNGEDLFASFKGENGGDYEGRKTYTSKNISNLTAADFIKVYSPKTKT